MLVKGHTYHLIENKHYTYIFTGIYLGMDLSNKYYFENQKGYVECVSSYDFSYIPKHSKL